MNKKQASLRLVAILLLAAVFMSACQQSVSNVPQATATKIAATGLFVTPLSGENPMEMIEKFRQGTAAAETATAAGGTPATPITAAEGTATATVPAFATQTPGTPTNTGVVATATTPVVGTQVTAAATTPVVVGTLPTVGPKPATYTLHEGEFPYCLARRFNVNPDELLALNGLTNGQVYYSNMTLKIPQTSSVFPATRALLPHPATYTVTSSSQTVYGVACVYGDVYPEQIAAANGFALSAKLTAGQKLTIP
jgi:LysM repeat protein